jgi:acetylglutamate kinase
MEIVARVLIDEIGHELLAIMRRSGGKAALLNGRDHGFLRATQKHLAAHPEADLQCVGEPVGIDPAPARALLAEHRVPLVAPVAVDAEGGGTLYNCNGDTASAFIARELGAAKLAFLSDTTGVYRRVDDPESLISTLAEAEVPALIRDGVIAGGMIPKVEACVEALRGGVGKAHIVSGYQPHALLLEIFTSQGVGTEIVH